MARLRRCLLASLLLAWAGAALADEPWRVVLIRSWDALYRVNAVREQGLRETLLDHPAREVEIYPEQVDSLRFRHEFDADNAAVMKSKYRGIKVDVVVAAGVEPLQFASRWRDEVWPGAAIVFMGVVDGWLEGWKRPARATGLTMVLDVEGTLSLGLALLPSARKVYFIAGDGEFDRAYLEQAKAVARRFEGRLEARYIVGLSRERILEEAAKAEPDALLVYLTVLRDAEGRYGGPFNTILAAIAERSRAPLLAAVHTQWRRGPVGGSSSRFDEHGRATGRLVRRVLEGADPDGIAIVAEPAPSCEVDWPSLARWSLPERNLPARCSLVNKPPEIWRAYFWPFVALVSVIAVQFALLWYVVVQGRRRRLAEERLRDRTAEMARVARMATMGELAANIAHEVNQPMGSILANAEAAKLMLDQGPLDPRKLREILDEICAEDLRASEVVRGARRMFAHRHPEMVRVDLNTEVGEALGHVAREAARRRIAIVAALAPAVPAVVADPVQLQQAIINLVVNALDAVAATPGAPGEVRVETRAVAGSAEIVVGDSGPGVDPSHVPVLFDSGFTTKVDGMGFGLPIVKTIVELQRGHVRYEPNVPRGARFVIRLPAAPARAAGTVAEPSPIPHKAD